jgi:VanZ family protein
MLGLYVLFMVYVSLFPFDLTLDGSTLRSGLDKAVLSPIDGEGRRTFPRTDLAGNGLLGLPLGLLLMSGIVRGSPRARLLQVGLLSFGVAGVVEAIQLFTPERTASVVDVGGQVTGALAGALGRHVLFRMTGTSLASVGLSALRRRPALGPAGALVAIMAAHRLYPYTATLDPRTVWDSVKRGAWMPLQAYRLPPWDAVVVSGVIPGAVLGALVVSLFAQLSPASRAAAWGLVTGYGVALELAKLFIEGSSPNANHALATSAGALLGVAIGPMIGAIPQVRARRGPILAAAAAALLVYDELWPFGFTMAMTSLGRVEWAPFSYYYEAEAAGAVLDVSRKLFLGGLLGGALHVWRLPRPVIWILGFAMLLEALQLFLHSRHPSVTDIICLTAGAAIGVGVLARYLALMADREPVGGHQA